MAIVEGTQRLKTAVFEYDFAVDGGAIGSINLRGVGGGASPIPAGATIQGGYIDVITPFTTGSAATLAVTVEGAGDIQAAAVVSGAPWSTAGRKSITPAFTGATAVRTTVQRQVVGVIAVGTITAGKAQIVLEYI